MDFVDCCWHVVTTSQVAKSVLADVTFHWEWKCTKHYTDSMNWHFAMWLKFFLLSLCAVQLHYDDGLSFIYLCRLHWMILLSLSSRTQSYSPLTLPLPMRDISKRKLQPNCTTSHILNWKSMQIASGDKLPQVPAWNWALWKEQHHPHGGACHWLPWQPARLLRQKPRGLSLNSEPKVTIGKCRLMRFIRCVRTTLSSPTPHTPRWREMGCSSSPKDDRWGLFYKIEIAIFSLTCYFKSCQATSDLRENPLVTVLGSHAAMTCQIVVGNEMSCILIEVKNILIDINWCWRWWSILKAVSQVSATLTITLAGRWNGDLNTLHVCHVLFLKVLLVPNTL